MHPINVTTTEQNKAVVQRLTKKLFQQNSKTLEKISTVDAGVISNIKEFEKAELFKLAQFKRV